MKKPVLSQITFTLEHMEGAADAFLDQFIGNKDYSSTVMVCGVPKGGVPFAMAIAHRTDLQLITYEEYLKQEDRSRVLLVEDVIDTGRTLEKINHPGRVAALHIKREHLNNSNIWGYNFILDGEWITYWWEGSTVGSIQDSVTRMLQYIGENPEREGLIDTPKRVVKAWDFLFSGYNQDPKELLRTFAEGACEDMVILKNIEFYSMCEHHLLPFNGHAHIAYIPNDKVIGVSKLARLLEIYTRRAQIQERIGTQVTDFLMNELGAKGAACIIKAQHLCMTSRGVEKQDSEMITSSIRGVFKTQPETRAELNALLQS